LISSVPKNISILILTQNITNLEAIKKAADKLPNKITIKKGDKLHDRFILTTCEGWHIGHTLKDFGTKSSLLTKLESTVEAENDFDEKWNQSKIIYKKGNY